MDPQAPSGYVPPPPKPESKGRSPLLVAGLACGGCLIVGVLVFVVGGGLLFHFAFGIFAEQVEAELRDNPVVVEHLGRLEEVDIDWWASMAEPGENDFVFEARGSKANGTLRVTSITIDAGTEDVVAGTLQLDSGEVHDLFEPLESEAAP